ncbi:MAG: tyrosine--tRNA ligase [Candidatus Heimdallarchaeota archaeon]
MTFEKETQILESLEKRTSEIITKDELFTLLTQIRSGRKVKGYIGVEPSGLFHVGWIIWARVLQQLIETGVEMHFLEATWHAKINDKLGGVMKNIHECAKYLEHCLASVGVDTKRLMFEKAEDLMDTLSYWETVMHVSKSMSLHRVRRALSIMGRKEDEVDSDFSKFLYPSLQVTDILTQRYEVCLGGMDQRRAHVLAREMIKKLELDWNPVAIHTPLLPGLSGAGRMDVLAVSEEEVYDRMIEGKMSKSKPSDATFIHDSEEEIKTKIMNAFCPQKVIVDNPIIAINQHVLFPEEGFELFIPRPQKYGGDLMLSSYEALVTKFRSGDLHPQDLKAATAKALINLLEPVRTYFAKHEEATRYKDRVARMVVTR